MNAVQWRKTNEKINGFAIVIIIYYPFVVCDTDVFTVEQFFFEFFRKFE